jgi:hypothetical protein
MIYTRPLVTESGDVVGKVEVTIVGNDVFVTITADPGYTLDSAYAFLGTGNVPLTPGGAVDLGQFPFSQQSPGTTATYHTSVCRLSGQ